MNSKKIVFISFAVSLFIIHVVLYKISLSFYTSVQLHQRLIDQARIIPMNESDYPSLLINTTGCKIPTIKQNSISSKLEFYPVTPIACEYTKPPLFESNRTSIYILESSLKAYGLSNKSLIKCCYTWVKRMAYQIDTQWPDITSLYQEECVYFNYSLNSPYEFIKVQCFKIMEYSKWNTFLYLKKQSPFYTDFFYFIHPIEFKIERRHEAKEQEPKFNVLVVGLDSLSRIHLHRQMPKTVEILKKFDAVEFFGYNKIAENTFPNVIAMLTGNSSDEVFHYCVNNSVFDQCKFIWDYYKAHGYITAFTEDATDTSLFTYTYGWPEKGFLKQPTDYYWNNFYREADDTIGNQNVYGIKYCFNSRKVHEILLEYLERFVVTMEENNLIYFGHFWQSILFHNDINQAQNGDDIYSDLLENLNKRHYLNNTVLLFMSDHGQRISYYRSSYEGMLEDRLPFLFIKLPDWMKHRYPHLQNNLITNSKRLITMYDIHETLKHLLNSSIFEESFQNIGTARGYPLFAPISENRTCDDVGIPQEFCTCQNNEPISIYNPVVIQIAKSMVSYINERILKGITVCLKLTLNSVLYARKYETAELSRSAEGSIHEDFTVAFKTMPSSATFEALVRRQTDQFEVQSLDLTGKIKRLNTYYNESLCVSDHFIKQYCFCYDLVK